MEDDNDINDGDEPVLEPEGAPEGLFGDNEHLVSLEDAKPTYAHEIARIAVLYDCVTSPEAKALVLRAGEALTTKLESMTRESMPSADLHLINPTTRRN